MIISPVVPLSTFRRHVHFDFAASVGPAAQMNSKRDGMRNGHTFSNGVLKLMSSELK